MTNTIFFAIFWAFKFVCILSKVNKRLCFRFRVYLKNRGFVLNHSTTTGWTHIVLNYLGPNEGEGIRIYYDGEEVGTEPTKTSPILTTGIGRIVLGRYYPDEEGHYSSIQVDELLFFNTELTNAEIGLIFNSD